jgi:hypothetical protein
MIGPWSLGWIGAASTCGGLSGPTVVLPWKPFPIGPETAHEGLQVVQAKQSRSADSQGNGRAEQHGINLSQK